MKKRFIDEQMLVIDGLQPRRCQDARRTLAAVL